MKIQRIFSRSSYKGTKNYLSTQKKYVILRTVILFALSLGIYIMGYVSTHSNKNLLTIVAVLGCLPASKSAVEMCMFLRYKSSPKSLTDEIEKCVGTLYASYDLVFTTYDKNFYVDHLVVCGNTICGFSSHEKMDVQLCEKHLLSVLKMDGFGDVSVKIFKDLHQYTSRLNKMKDLESVQEKNELIMASLLSVSL